MNYIIYRALFLSECNNKNHYRNVMVFFIVSRGTNNKLYNLLINDLKNKPFYLILMQLGYLHKQR